MYFYSDLLLVFFILFIDKFSTREMQGIVGQASAFVAVISKIDWTLLHEIWWRKMEKIKNDWRATLWYGFFAWTCCVPPPHTTHLNFVLSYFIINVHIQLSYNAFLFTHARSSTSDWHRHQRSQLDSLSLHRLPAFLLVATSHLLSSLLNKFFLRWSLFHHVGAISPRTSSTVVRVQVVGVCEVHTLAGMPGLVIVLDRPGLRLPMRKKENVEERLKQLYSRSQLAPS